MQKRLPGVKPWFILASPAIIPIAENRHYHNMSSDIMENMGSSKMTQYFFYTRHSE